MRKHHLLTLQEMQTVLGISERTARRYLSQPGGMPDGLATLWRLHCAGRIVPESWQGVRFTGERLSTDTGHSLQYGQALQYAWHLQCLDLLLRDVTALSARVRELEQRRPLPKKDLEKLARIQKIERELQQGLPALCRPAPLMHRKQGC